MTTELVCVLCGKSTSSFFISIGTVMICQECKTTTKGKIPQFQKPRVFTRYICLTHKCGTYSVGKMMIGHEMKDCYIVTKETLGIVKPATYGGINGDIGRGQFLGVNDMDRLLTNLKNYKKFTYIHLKLRRPMSLTKVSFHSRKYYRKHLRYLNIVSEIDYHKNDELFKKLKFNLNVFIQMTRKKYRPVMTQKERSNLYYKDLIKNFTKQVIHK